MKKYLLILIGCTLLLSACKKKDQDEDINEPLWYEDILNPGFPWKYAMNAICPNQIGGLDGGLVFEPLHLKVYQDRLELFSYKRLLSQQGDVYEYYGFYNSFSQGGKPSEFDFSKYGRGNELIADNEMPDFMQLQGIYYAGAGYTDNRLYSSNYTLLNEFKRYYPYDQLIYTSDNRFFLVGNTHTGLEVDNNNFPVYIRNTIADSAIYIRNLYYDARKELQELFISENGYLTSAVMRTEKDTTPILYHYTDIISVDYDKSHQKFNLASTMKLTKRNDGKYMVGVYDCVANTVSSFLYNPEDFTIQYQKTSAPLPDSLNDFFISSTGKMYGVVFKTTFTLYAENGGVWTPYSTAGMFNKHSAFMRNMYMIRDKIFATVTYQYGAQISVLEFTGN